MMKNLIDEHDPIIKESEMIDLTFDDSNDDSLLSTDITFDLNKTTKYKMQLRQIEQQLGLA